ncbi:MAG: adenosylhomocysteinase [Armatimonadota bacterium]|nr:adenosylhomocysteinase [Armatimonadota bacterium]MDR7427856.1 adenosylhomocysteinase [Armatimonadota bacterium]MDR7465027.1 adenosylhomocysteinase [Armatimonadota bacterium]MDR7470765.1 adenosylhomocysteinase [Armatimonadota bacterium]MDR7475320.1 adenosylhomocysteinase [Armatimonadota bacterium]
MEFEVRGRDTVGEGRARIAWAEREMPVLRSICARFARERPLAGMRIAACLHVTSETAALVRTLMAGGATVRLCASNPLSTQDDVAAALVEEQVEVFAIRGEDRESYYRHIQRALDLRPQITMDDGADLVTAVHEQRRELLPEIVGGTEETTTGVIRLRAMAREGALRYPIIAVNDARTKHLFDNRYGTGQSTIDGLLRATNLLLAGRVVVVCGYGLCGRGVALRARGMGARVIVTEVDPLRALEAVMEGYQVMPLLLAAEVGEVFITVTGNRDVIRREHLERMRDGAVLANSGHFNVEIDIPALEAMATGKERIREYVDEYRLSDGRRISLLAEGRLLNLAAAEGHPAAVMDMSFANQALSVEYLVRGERQLVPDVYPVPAAIDAAVARLKLEAMGIAIDALTPEQERYLRSWTEGT